MSPAPLTDRPSPGGRQARRRQGRSARKWAAAGCGPSAGAPGAASTPVGGGRGAPGSRGTSRGSGLLACPAGLDRRPAPPAPLTRPAVHGEAADARRGRRPARRAGGWPAPAWRPTLTRRIGVGLGQVADRANGLSSPAHRTSDRYTLPRPQNTRWSSSTSAIVALGGRRRPAAASTQRRRSASARHRSGPSPRSPGWRLASGRRYVSTTGALKHTATHPSTSISTRRWRWGRCQHSPGPVEVPRPAHPHVGVQDDAVVPLHLEVPPVALDPLDGAAGAGRRRRSSVGRSKRTIFWSTSAVRSAAAVRWMVSPSGIDHHSTAAGPACGRGCRRYGSSPQWARARRIRRSWPPVICSRTPGPTASAHPNHARSRASCVGWQSPSTGTT